MPDYGLGRFEGSMGSDNPSLSDRDDSRGNDRYDRAYDRGYEGLGRHGLYPSQSSGFERESTSGYGGDSNFGGRSYGTFGERPSSGRYFGRTHNDYDPSYYRDRDYRGRDYRGANEESHGMWESVKDFFGKGPKGYSRSDERITEDVNDALTRDRNVDASNIEVSAQDGIVTLTGNVSDKWMKRQAEDCAEEVTGVKEVRNQIEVRAESRPSGMGGTLGTAGSTGVGTAAGSGLEKGTESKRKSA
jgi:hypothetical protein